MYSILHIYIYVFYIHIYIYRTGINLFPSSRLAKKSNINHCTVNFRLVTVGGLKWRLVLVNEEILDLVYIIYCVCFNRACIYLFTYIYIDISIYIYIYILTWCCELTSSVVGLGKLSRAQLRTGMIFHIKVADETISNLYCIAFLVYPVEVFSSLLVYKLREW
jgi:hypothetical protein